MIRRAEEKDIDIIAEYNCRLALETEGIKLDQEQVKKGVKQGIIDDKAQYFLYEIRGQVVGQLMLTKEWSDWRNGYFYWIQSVYVNKDYRRQGIFKKLYSKVEDIVKDSSESCGIRLYVEKDNKKAKNTYENLGMTKTPYHIYEWEI
ncbi:MAG: GNAT family N-acetyltransferase [Bacillota bacterium]